MGVMMFVLLPITATTETACSGVSCIDNLGEISLRITATDLIIEVPATTQQNITSHGLSSSVSYPFSVSYETATGKISLIVDNNEVTFTTTEQLGYETANLILTSIDGGSSISMSDLVLNGDSMASISTPSGSLMGMDYINILADNGGFLFEGNLTMTMTGTTKVSFNMWDSVIVEEAYDLEILANEVNSFNFSITDDIPTTTLGGLSILVFEQERRSLSFGTELIWEKITNIDVENFDVVSWNSRDVPIWASLVCSVLFEKSEEFLLNGQLGIYETYNCDDTIGTGFKSSSIGISNFQILPSGSTLDIYLLVL